MANLYTWIQGSRPRTWANPLAASLTGIGISLRNQPDIDLDNTVLIILTALTLTIGVNFANDYSDGVKGADSADRIGPMRLVGSGKVSAPVVKIAAILSVVAAITLGLVLCWRIRSWPLLAIGVLCVIALWSYTSGPLSFGYRGYGELAVFIFYGLIGVLGAQYVLTDNITLEGLIAAMCVGSFSAAILATNNLRDIDNDKSHGKKTFAVRFWC